MLVRLVFANHYGFENVWLHCWWSNTFLRVWKIVIICQFHDTIKKKVEIRKLSINIFTEFSTESTLKYFLVRLLILEPLYASFGHRSLSLFFVNTDSGPPLSIFPSLYWRSSCYFVCSMQMFLLCFIFLHCIIVLPILQHLWQHYLPIATYVGICYSSDPFIYHFVSQVYSWHACSLTHYDLLFS